MSISLIELQRRLRHNASRMVGLRSNPAGPHFLGIGTQKGGTSSLYHLLKRHPNVYLPANKEQITSPHTMNKARLGMNANSPMRLLDRSAGNHPYYLFHPKVPERIYHYRASMLLIALLRDPVDRALSQYFHAFRHGFETLSLEDALAAEPERMASGDPYNHQKHSYVSRSRYEKQLKRYEGFFNRNQILLLRSEDLFHNTQQCWIKIQRFLGLNLQLTEQTLPWVNGGQGESASVSDDIRRRIRETLTPTYENLRKNYGISWD